MSTSDPREHIQDQNSSVVLENFSKSYFSVRLPLPPPPPRKGAAPAWENLRDTLEYDFFAEAEHVFQVKDLDHGELNGHDGKN